MTDKGLALIHRRAIKPVDESAEFVAGNCNPACSVVPPQLALAAYNVTVLFLESNGDPLRDFEIRSDRERRHARTLRQCTVGCDDTEVGPSP